MSASKSTTGNGLRSISRYITDHDDQGNTTMIKDIPPEIPWQQMANGDRFSLAYATEEIPVQLSNGADVEIYKRNLQNLPGVIIPGGTVLRMVDIRPGMRS